MTRPSDNIHAKRVVGDLSMIKLKWHSLCNHSHSRTYVGRETLSFMDARRRQGDGGVNVRQQLCGGARVKGEIRWSF